MKLTTTLLALLSALTTSVSADDTPSITTTITARAGCPTGPAPDVIVTRSAVPVPSCEAGNSTKPSIVSMPGYGAVPTGPGGVPTGPGGMPGASSTSTGGPVQFTGAAGRNVVQGMVVAVGGLAVFLM